MIEFGSNQTRGKQGTLLVWDVDGPPPSGHWTSILWKSYGDGDVNVNSEVISIPKLVEDRAETYRARYLSWIYELGEKRISGKRLVDHLQVRPGFSYWWMTAFAEKFNASGKSEINNAIKLLALEDLVRNYEATAIIFKSSNEKLGSTLERFCRKSNVDFTWSYQKTVRKTKLKLSARSIFINTLPYFFQALIFFVLYLLKWARLSFAQEKSIVKLEGDRSFIDILVHLDKRAMRDGTFVSNYWASLVDVVSESGSQTNWLHHFFYQDEIPSLIAAQKLVHRFNKNSVKPQFHGLIEASLSPIVFLKALKDYVRTTLLSYSLPKSNDYFVPSGSTLNFFALFEHEWSASLRGKDAIINFIRLALYEKILNSIPRQEMGIYIQENQPWEMALIHAWKTAGHGKLVGLPHTTVRFWDLRYFFDSRSYDPSGKNNLPVPDVVAVNGPVAKKTYLDGGYPPNRIEGVEALRFLHLSRQAQAITTQTYNREELRVLICGDFLETTNNKLLSWIDIAACSLPHTISFILKPHPAYPLNLGDFPEWRSKVVEEDLPVLLQNCDVVFASSITSAAVDAYCAGVPVIQLLDGETFNMSPLREMKGVMYVKNPRELGEALLNIKRHEHKRSQPYFYLDEELPLWRDLLGLTRMNES